MAKKALKASLHKSIKKQSISSEKAVALCSDSKVPKKRTSLPSSKLKPLSLDEHTLPPKAQQLLEELSDELGLSKEVVASMAITLYSLYKEKA